MSSPLAAAGWSPCDYYDQFHHPRRATPVGNIIIIVIVLSHWAMRFDQLYHWYGMLEALLHMAIVAASVRLVYDMTQRAGSTMVQARRALARFGRALAGVIARLFRWVAGRVEVRGRFSVRLGRI